MIELMDYLIDKGIGTYFINSHVGECLNNYVVVKDNGVKGLMSNKIGVQLIDLILFVPFGHYGDVDTFKNEVKNIMKDFKYARYTGVETEVIIEDKYKAYSTSIMYEIQKIL